MPFFNRQIAPTTLSLYHAALAIEHTVSCVRQGVCYYRLTMTYLSGVSRDGNPAFRPLFRLFQVLPNREYQVYMYSLLI